MQTAEIRVLDPRLFDYATPTDRATPGASAYDLRACLEAPLTLNPGEPAVLVPTGVAFNLSNTTVAGLLMPRSGLSHKRGLRLSNGVGLIDTDYQGQIFASCYAQGPEPVVIEPMERFCQILFTPVAPLAIELVDQFEANTVRGAQGFGHSGES